MGIQVGTAIAMLIRKADHSPAGTVGFRHLWGQAKREDLTATADRWNRRNSIPDVIEPVLPLGLPFAVVAVSRNWHDWPSLPDLFPTRFLGSQLTETRFSWI